MAWTAPMTAINGEPFSAADYNTYVRDNLLETAPAKAATAGGYFVATPSGRIAERGSSGAYVATSQQTSSGTYGDLATAGPSVTVTTGTSALVWIAARMRNTGADGQSAHASVAVGGSTALGPSDDWAISTGGILGDNPQRIGGVHRFDGLTSGANTFTMKYRASPGYGPAQFEYREIIVMPF